MPRKVAVELEKDVAVSAGRAVYGPGPADQPEECFAVEGKHSGL